MSKKIININRTILAYIAGIVLLINCRTVWMSEPNLSSKLNILSYFFLVVSLVGLIASYIFQKNYIHSLHRLIQHILILILYLSVFFVFSKNNLNTVFRLSILLLLIYCYIYMEDSYIPTILIAYKNILVVFGIISILYWTAGSLLGILHSTKFVFSSWGAVNGIYNIIPSYHNFYFETQHITVPIIGEICRNSSIFAEAPMASLNFSLGLLIEYFSKKSSKMTINSWIFSICIITTFSTSGYFILLFMLFYKFMNSKRINSYIKLSLLMPIIISGIVICVYLLKLKITGTGDSGSIRLNDYKLGFITWIQHPFLGNGINNIGAITQNMESWRLSNSGFSNSIMEVLAQGGIYIFILYFYAFIKSFYSSIEMNNSRLFLFTTCLLFLFIVTSFPYQYILLVILEWFTILQYKDRNLHD